MFNWKLLKNSFCKEAFSFVRAFLLDLQKRCEAFKNLEQAFKKHSEPFWRKKAQWSFLKKVQ